MPTDTKVEAQVICTRVIWFEDAEINGGQTKTRHNASYGEVVEMPESEFDRIAAEGGVQEPGGTLPRSEVPKATPFSQPRADVSFEGPVMGDPNPNPSANMGVGGLSEEQIARLNAQADGEDDPSMTDEDYIAEAQYEKAGVEALKEEAVALDIYDEIQGTGANGNVLKGDIVAALEKDDE